MYHSIRSISLAGLAGRQGGAKEWLCLPQVKGLQNAWRFDLRMLAKVRMHQPLPALPGSSTAAA